MFIRGYNHSLLKSPEQKPKWPKSFSNHPTSWTTTTLEAIHHIHIYIFSMFNVLSLHSNGKHDFWDTKLYSRSWSVAWMCLSLLWIGSMVVPGTKAENSQPEPNNWELEGIFGRSTTCLILRLKGAELYTRAVRPLRPVPTVTSQIAQLETIKKAVRRENMQGAPNWAMSTLD